jgi:hypothetical protein
MLAFIEFVPTEKYLKCCSSIMTLGHTQVGAPKRPSQILDGECCCIPYTVLTLHHQIIGHLVLGQNACEDTTNANDKVPQKDVNHGCRRGTVTFTRWKYMFLFKGGTGVSTKT